MDWRRQAAMFTLSPYLCPIRVDIAMICEALL